MTATTPVTTPVNAPATTGGRILAWFRVSTTRNRARRVAPVAAPTAMPTRFGDSYLWPDGSWTHSS
ncbi:hypothetical protein DQ238_10295 [Geodermatophilus sp. TF02-6]|uniref:hypothetical protein n=1 Tax=Geodermatophilus sp. TF02-6 TaxID=2250575 RepID=UPI000DE8C541|nr:hypothetical protein [Geodermatophilus sp. TF02-6]RBY79576.1 hypothetical protein DQ238_10295 [Geodermatophilus sp. TF02-6]